MIEAGTGLRRPACCARIFGLVPGGGSISPRAPLPPSAGENGGSCGRGMKGTRPVC